MNGSFDVLGTRSRRLYADSVHLSLKFLLPNAFSRIPASLGHDLSKLRAVRLTENWHSTLLQESLAN